MINVNAIRSDDDLKNALSRIDEIFDAEPGSKEEEELEILTALVEAYEAKHHPVLYPDPVSADMKGEFDNLGKEARNSADAPKNVHRRFAGAMVEKYQSQLA